MIRYEPNQHILKDQLAEYVISNNRIYIDNIDVTPDAPFPGYYVRSAKHRFDFKPVYDIHLCRWATMVEYSRMVGDLQHHISVVYINNTDLLLKCKQRFLPPMVNESESRFDLIMSAVRQFVSDKTK